MRLKLNQIFRIMDVIRVIINDGIVYNQDIQKIDYLWLVNIIELNFVILVNPIDTFGSVSTGVGHTLVDVYFTILTGRTSSAPTLISVYQVLARPTMLTRGRRAFVQLILAQQSGVTRMTGTRERVLAIDALAVLTWVGQTIVDIVLAVEARETRGTLTLVTSDRIMANATMTAWAAHAVINIGLTPGSGEPCRARTLESINHVGARAAILAWIGVTFVYVNFTLSAGKS